MLAASGDVPAWVLAMGGIAIFLGSTYVAVSDKIVSAKRYKEVKDERDAYLKLLLDNQPELIAALKASNELVVQARYEAQRRRSAQ
jgi:hypothetical protein